MSDTVSARISVATHQGSGYVENRLSPDQDLNNANEYAGRFQLLIEPSENAEILLNVRYGAQDIRTGFFEYSSALFPNGERTPGQPNANLGGYVDLDGDVYAGDYDRTGHNDLETKGYTATIKYDFGGAELTSITDYQEVTRDYIEDSDASPVDYFSFFLTTDAEQFSQELRLAGETDALDWVVGFYYLDLDINDTNGGITPALFEGLFGASVEDLGFNGIRNPYTTQTESWSFFGQAEYAVTDKMSLVGGFRWIEEDKSHEYRDILFLFPDTATSGLDPNAIEIVDAVAPYSGEQSTGEWSARLALNYIASDDLLLYASWNRGLKSGGFNAPLLPTDVFVTDLLMEYGPEKLDAYEVGFKWDAADGKLRVNGAAYYYDYKSCQVFSIIQLDTFTLNGDCESKGFELEVQAAPADGLDVQFGIGYVDADVRDVPGVTVDAETPVGSIPAFLPGATLTPVQTPDWNLNGLIRYEFPVGNGSLALQTSGQYRSEHFFTLLATDASTENGYFLADASATWAPEDANWSLRFFVQNLTGEKYLVQTFDLSGNLDNGGLFGLVEEYYGRPRTWGKRQL